MVPDGMGRNKTLREADQLRSVVTRFADQAAGLFDRALVIEEHRRGCIAATLTTG